MKTLNRILLINWHNYSFQLIPVKMITFLTGKTAAGKSTIIDALQLVLLADTQGSSFNKAANQKSSRTLKGYLFGEQGDDGDGIRASRSGGNFSSYVALEFYDDVAACPYTCVFMADCYSDQSFSPKWFILYSDGIPENNFIQEGHPMNYDQLKAFLKKNYSESRASFFDSNKSYLAAYLSKSGALDEKYTSLLRKAVPFTPISDITKFITESICDIENNIDIENMSSDIRAYKLLEREVNLMAEKIAELDAIRNSYSDLCILRDRKKEYGYITSRAELSEIEDRLKMLKNAEGKACAELSHLEEELAERDLEKTGLDKELEDLRQKLYSNDSFTLKTSLEKQVKELSIEIRNRGAMAEKSASRVAETAAHWLTASKSGIEVAQSSLSLLLAASTVNASSISSINLRNFAELTVSLYNKFLSRKITLENSIADAQRRISEKKKLIASLESGIKPLPIECERFMDEFESLTGERPQVLADLLELNDETWRTAAESYLGDDRFTLIVSAENLDKAYSLLPSYKDVRLYDLEGSAEVLQGSLLACLKVQNPEAERLSSMLLGSVKALSAPDFSDSGDWVSQDGTFHKNGEQVRKLVPYPFIGHEATILMLEAEKQSLTKLETVLDEFESELAALKEAVDAEDSIQQSSYLILEETFRKNDEIPLLKKQLAEINEKLSSLDLDVITRLDNEIKDRSAYRARLDNIISELNQKKGTANSERKQLAEVTIPGAEAQRKRCLSYIEEQYEKSWIETTGEPKYLEAASRERVMRTLSETYRQQSASISTQIEKSFGKLVSLRIKYNASHLISYDPQKEDNNEYEAELVKLQDNQLPKYKEKINAAKESAYNQFRDDFISRIKSNIEQIQMNIRTLNKALDGFTFGTDKYKFEVSPRKEYQRFYSMFTDELLMDSRDNLWAGSFEDKYRDEINELFSILIYDKDKSSAEEQRNNEKKIALYTDYRTYLVFDLLVIDTDGNTQRLSRTLQKKSGGETQLPFYIALLASFSQVCKIRSKVSNNTLRLIILDEAFSKMDGERIRESIRLLKEFSLQAIFSAPPEKTSDISTLVDETLMVYKERNHSFVEEYSRE